MENLLVVPVVAPILVTAVSLIARPRASVRRALGTFGYLLVLGVSVTLVVLTSGGQPLVLHVGGWPPGIAIVLVADLFAALMLTVASLMTLVCAAFAFARAEDDQPLFHPLAGILQCGIGGAFLTGDLFNLFVFFEVMLIASYVLLTLGAKREQIRGGAVYVTTNLLASTLFLAAVALLYGSTGRVNMAALSAGPGSDPAIGVAGALLFVAFSVKSGLVPIHGWLPSAYPVASPAVAALFSGLLTKVGVYAIYRVYSVVFRGDPAFRRVLLGVAAITMLVGVLGALGQGTMRSILSFHITSQIGYMVMGLGLFGVVGVAGGIFYIIHHIVVKTALFLAAGAVETFRGTGRLSGLGGLARTHTVLASGFIVAALALAGLPPLSGFFAKLVLVREAMGQAEYAVVGVAVGVSFLTLLSMIKIWSGVFWGPTSGEEDVQAPYPRRRAAVVAPCVLLAAIAVILGLGAQGLYSLAETAARDLVDPSRYVTAVLGR